MAELKSQKISEIIQWISLNQEINSISPHYNVDSSDPDSDNALSDSDTPFDPFKLSDKLKSCPICFSRYGTPNETLKCLKNHNVHLCYFCYKLIDGDVITITRHFKSRGHFSNEGRCLVKCPFPDCDPSKEFNHLTGIKVHITRVHLPSTYTICSEECISIEGHGGRNRSGSGSLNSFGNKSLISDVLVPVAVNIKTEQHEETRKISPIRIRSSTNQVAGETLFSKETEMMKKKTLLDARLSPFIELSKELLIEAKMSYKKSSGGLTTASISSSCSSSVVEISKLNKENLISQRRYQKPLFICQLCDKLYGYRMELMNHKTEEKCEWMTGKSCSHCRCSFNGFSILNCIRHLLACPNSCS